MKCFDHSLPPPPLLAPPPAALPSALTALPPTALSALPPRAQPLALSRRQRKTLLLAGQWSAGKRLAVGQLVPLWAVLLHGLAGKKQQANGPSHSNPNLDLSYKVK